MIPLKTNSGCPDHGPDTEKTMREVATSVDESADASGDQMTAIEADPTILCDVLACGRDQNQARGPCPTP